MCSVLSSSKQYENIISEDSIELKNEFGSMALSFNHFKEIDAKIKKCKQYCFGKLNLLRAALPSLINFIAHKLKHLSLLCTVQLNSNLSALLFMLEKLSYYLITPLHPLHTYGGWLISRRENSTQYTRHN